MKRVGKGFSGVVTPLYPSIMVQAQEEMGEGSANPTDPHHTPTITQPSTSQPQKKQKSRKTKKKDTKIPQSSGLIEPIVDEAANEENVPIHSNDLLLNGLDDYELLNGCTQEEQEELTFEDMSKLFTLLKKWRKHFVSKESLKKGRNDHPQNQQRRLIRIEKVDVKTKYEMKYDELQSLMEIVFDEEGVAIDAIPLATKPPSIVD
ncbi:hypothetical protein Tco_1425672 [Tanacetum coccineum]